MADYKTTIGMEVHVELNTASKMFCACPTSFGAEPNSNVCPVCLGLPGSLPVINRQALIRTVKTGLALGSEIAEFSKFDRKNYYYPDLPKAYQISQYDLPLCGGGFLMIELEKGEKRIGITRVHLEEDTGKTLHESKSGRIEDAAFSLVDYNRSGTPLMEIVSEPDMESSAEAAAYLTTLRCLLRYLEVSDCNMEEGSMRCEANISVRPAGSDELGVKVEIKNMNSIRNLQQAMEYEAARQVKAIESGEKVVQETRHWQENKEVTIPMRSKETAPDYRYFPEPDLPPVVFPQELVRQLESELPELPPAKKTRFVEELGLSAYDAGVLVADKQLAGYFEECLREFPHAKTVSNWLTSELIGRLNKLGQHIGESKVSASHLVGLLKMVEAGKLSSKQAKEVLDEMVASGKEPSQVAADKELSQLSDSGELEKIVDAAIKANPDPVAEYKDGNEKALGFLMGQVMKLSRGQANPQEASRMLKDKLSG